MMKYSRTEKPKRCLTAYNFFFQETRQALLDSLPSKSGPAKPKRSHGKIGFQELARTISAKWKTVTPQEKTIYLEMAKKDKERYLKEMEEWRSALEDECVRELVNEEEKVPVVSRSRAIMTTRIVSHTEPEVKPQLQASPCAHTLPPAKPAITLEETWIPRPVSGEFPIDIISEDFWDISHPQEVFDNSAVNSIPSEFVLDPAPVHVSNQNSQQTFGVETDRFLMMELAGKLDQDCQEFLMAAFAHI